MFPTRLNYVAALIFAITGLYIGLIYESSIAIATSIIASANAISAYLLTGAQKRRLREPEYAYHYGYGKFESLSTIYAGSLYVLGCAYTIYRLILAISEPFSAVIGFAIVILYATASLAFGIGNLIYISSRATKIGNDIIEREAELVRLDVYFKVFALATALAAFVLYAKGNEAGAALTDSLSGLALLAIALFGALKGFKDALDQLLDRTLPEEIQYEIIASIADNINKICEIKSVHTRRAGKGIFIEIDVVLPWNYTLEQAFEIERELTAPIINKYPNAKVRLYALPCKRDCASGGEDNCPPEKKKTPEMPSGRKS